MLYCTVQLLWFQLLFHVFADLQSYVQAVLKTSKISFSVEMATKNLRKAIDCCKDAKENVTSGIGLYLQHKYKHIYMICAIK